MGELNNFSGKGNILHVNGTLLQLLTIFSRCLRSPVSRYFEFDFLKSFLVSPLNKFSNNMEFHLYEVYFKLSNK